MSTVILAEGSGDSGKELAKAFLLEGYNVAVLSRSQMDCNEVVRQIRSTDDVPIAPYICRTTDMQEVDEHFKKVKSRFGSIDVLVNNTELPFQRLDMGQEKRNAAAEPFISGIYICSYFAAQHMDKNGKIINVVPIHSEFQASELNGRLMAVTSELARLLRKLKVSCILPAYQKPLPDHCPDYYPHMASEALRYAKHAKPISGTISIAGNASPLNTRINTSYLC